MSDDAKKEEVPHDAEAWIACKDSYRNLWIARVGAHYGHGESEAEAYKAAVFNSRLRGDVHNHYPSSLPLSLERKKPRDLTKRIRS